MADLQPAGEEIPFGAPVRLVDGAWFATSIEAMEAMAARPRSSIRRMGEAGPARTSWLPGDPVEIVTEGERLVIAPDRHVLPNGTVLLPGEKLMATLRAGRIVA